MCLAEQRLGLRGARDRQDAGPTVRPAARDLLHLRSFAKFASNHLPFLPVGKLVGKCEQQQTLLRLPTQKKPTPFWIGFLYWLTMFVRKSLRW
jgi:hypothetical protein